MRSFVGFSDEISKSRAVIHMSRDIAEDSESHLIRDKFLDHLAGDTGSQSKKIVPEAFGGNDNKIGPMTTCLTNQVDSAPDAVQADPFRCAFHNADTLDFVDGVRHGSTLTWTHAESVHSRRSVYSPDCRSSLHHLCGSFNTNYTNCTNPSAVSAVQPHTMPCNSDRAASVRSPTDQNAVRGAHVLPGRGDKYYFTITGASPGSSVTLASVSNRRTSRLLLPVR